MSAPDLAARLDDLAGTGSLFGGLMEQWTWADDEIAQAQQRHPAAADRLYHSFGLLCAPHELMTTEPVYRAHCREILDRVAADADTRPGTAAEVLTVCSESSLVAPLTSAGAGLYGRMWQAAGLPADLADDQDYHEALHGSLIDEAERVTRRKAADPDRRLGTIECRADHRGDGTACAYALAA